jgi:hypothetical protein
MRGKLLFCAILLAGLPALAQPPKFVDVTFECEPAGATVSDQYGFVGYANNVTHLDVSKYDPDAPSYSITFHKQGYKDQSIDFNGDRIRQQSQLPLVRLEPATLSMWLQVHAWAVGSATLALSGLVAFGATRQRKVRTLETREQFLDTFTKVDSLVTRPMGNYRLLDRLGTGGMASVYRAVPNNSFDPSQAVAIKVLRQDVLVDAEFMERFRREAAVTRSLDHPNIMRLIDWGEEGSYAYLVLELIDGGSLSSRLVAGEALPKREVWSALEPLCAAVAYAHDRGVVHRDLKPDNLMITRSGLLKVADFGLARDQNLKTITMSGVTLGTPAYMSPEQINGDRHHPAMDQYAIGIITYQLLTGFRPFDESDPIQTLFAAISKVPPLPSSRAKLSPQVDVVVMKMIAKKAADRYPDLRQAATALREVLVGK